MTTLVGVSDEIEYQMHTDESNSKSSVFFAFPKTPSHLYDCIIRGIELANKSSTDLVFSGWPDNDIAGRPLTEPIINKIEKASFVVADVTVLNFNVTFEIGFAIGSGKRTFLIHNETFNDDSSKVSKVGIFDTLGYATYTNAESLQQHLLSEIDQTPLDVSSARDQKAPVYLLETPHRGDAMTRIISRVKKARLQYRSFNPSEDIRMAAIDVIKHVASSHGVIAPLLSSAMRDADIHNIRAAFVAGLALGMEKPLLIMQQEEGGELSPLDVRDFVKSYSRIEDIDENINKFALDVVQSMQASESDNAPQTGKLTQLKIGDPMAENEFQTLEDYYLRRDEFTRTIRGDVNIVVGRKGAGKTALFSQLRNELRRNRTTIVVDLKPEGYQLVKLKEAVLEHLTPGAKAHLVTAFWEYILLLEVAYKLLEKDAPVHLRNHLIRPHYVKLKETYHHSPNVFLGDFSERLIELSSFLSDKYKDLFGDSNEQTLTSDEVTEIIHTGNLKELRNDISDYLEHKNGVWILFDNLDKGWSVPGPTTSDILILRSLIDAARKIQRDMQRKQHDFHCVVFIRNDVYQLLMKESPDFGKEMRVSLDWNDAEMLREMLRLRLVQNGYKKETTFNSLWTGLCISHYMTEETSQYMIDRCLMRPRNLLKIFNHCKGSAVNFRHDKIEPEDLEKGMVNYSNDLLIEADQELANIEPLAAEVIYHFMGEDWRFSREELIIIFEDHALPGDKYDEVILFLLYFGFFGIQMDGKDPVYIFDVGYDMKRLEVQIQKHPEHITYVLNPAFWPALEVGPS